MRVQYKCDGKKKLGRKMCKVKKLSKDGKMKKGWKVGDI